MYSSETDLAQDALDQIGAETIASIDATDSANAVRCKRALPKAIRQVLLAGDWEFARKYANGAQITNDRPETWGYRHQMPGDLVRLIGVEDAQTGSPYRDIWQVRDDYRSGIVRPAPYQRVGDTIYSHFEILRVFYVWHYSAVTAWPSAAQEACMWALVAKIIWSITKDEDQAERARRIAVNRIAAALVVDGNEGQQQMPDEASWQAARF